MSYSNRIRIGAASAVLLAGAVTAVAPAQADGTGAFVGGLLAGKVMNNMSRRTDAEEEQAYYAQQNSQQQVQQAAPAAPAAKSPQQRLDELDKLAAGGYITPDEYKKKKQAIIDSM